ncbi:hypothetical protein CUMW_133710 [Citrus unshiu]|nr:hypothetical protein CUMW_133710 [Citrus unshiu]GAY51373.1 hypothetical protein CUMW_133710 [Citrus unshiu]
MRLTLGSLKMLEKMETVDVDELIEEFETITKDAERIQRETLRKILEENASAEYLQNLGLNGRTDPESFKSCVPLVTHEDLQPYIQRIIDVLGRLKESPNFYPLMMN